MIVLPCSQHGAKLRARGEQRLVKPHARQPLTMLIPRQDIGHQSRCRTHDLFFMEPAPSSVLSRVEPPKFEGNAGTQVNSSYFVAANSDDNHRSQGIPAASQRLAVEFLHSRDGLANCGSQVEGQSDLKHRPAQELALSIAIRRNVRALQAKAGSRGIMVERVRGTAD